MNVTFFRLEKVLVNNLVTDSAVVAGIENS